ncbi:MAG: M15 family metallopeptidase [Oscillospiraceae bacterium]|nr:M15 family metallopeptidase [Oscillospiraceae bacterium]
MKRVLQAVLLILLIGALGAIVFLRQYGQGFEPSPSPSPIVTATPTPVPTATPTPTPTPEPYADKPDIDISSWEYTLVNKENLLSADFAPELTAIENGQYFDSRAVEALNEFVAAAKAEGLTVYITSSYRNYATQESLFNNKVNQYISSEGSKEAASEKAKTIVAYPGTSEHQLGLACDIVDKYYQYMNETLADTELSKWMAAHSAEYGFILRYPKDRTDITGVMFEPWHFRYVGKEAAGYITAKALTYEEFVALYK